MRAYDAGMKIAVLDDWQHVARGSADWAPLQARAEIVFFHAPPGDEDEVAARLAEFDIIMAMRERTPFPASLVRRLPRLKMFSLPGHRARLIDMAEMTRRGITVCTTGGGDSGASTAELALALMLAAARGVAQGDATIRTGQFQMGTAAGIELAGRTLGVIGLGRIGRLMARYGTALGMRVLAWSPNLTADAASAGGATLAAKDDLLAQADVVSLHLVLSDRSAGIIGADALARMKQGAILVNTSRAGLVDLPALYAALRERRLIAALDVFEIEPLPPDHPILALPNTVLTPHIGYGTIETFREFYGLCVANVLAYLDGAPTNVFKP
jgi:phosphoglycerate dehydrogenase-like enzyme